MFMPASATTSLEPGMSVVGGESVLSDLSDLAPSYDRSTMVVEEVVPAAVEPEPTPPAPEEAPSEPEPEVSTEVEKPETSAEEVSVDAETVETAPDTETASEEAPKPKTTSRSRSKTSS